MIWLGDLAKVYVENWERIRGLWKNTKEGSLIVIALSPLPENPSLLRLGMKAARSEAEAESPLPEPDTTGFSPCVVHFINLYFLGRDALKREQVNIIKLIRNHSYYAIL